MIAPKGGLMFNKPSTDESLEMLNAQINTIGEQGIYEEEEDYKKAWNKVQEEVAKQRSIIEMEDNILKEEFEKTYQPTSPDEISAFNNYSKKDNLEGYLNYKNLSNRIKDLESKMEYKVRGDEVEKEYEEATGLKALWKGIENLSYGVRNRIEDLKAKSAVFNVVSGFSLTPLQFGRNYTGISREETKEYFDLLKQKRVLDEPIVLEEKKLNDERLNAWKIREKSVEGREFKKHFPRADTPVGYGGIPYKEGSNEERDSTKLLPEELSLYKSEVPKSMNYREVPGLTSFLDQEERVAVSEKEYREFQKNATAFFREGRVLKDNDEKYKRYLNNKEDRWYGAVYGAYAGLGFHAEDLLSFGLYSYDISTYAADIKIKQQNEEQLTEYEEKFAQAIALRDEINSKDLFKDMYWTNAFDGLGHSAVYMEQMAVTAPIGGAVGNVVKSISTPLVKKLALATAKKGIISPASGRVLSSAASKEWIHSIEFSKNMIANKGINTLEKAALNGYRIANNTLVTTSALTAQTFLQPGSYTMGNERFLGVTVLYQDTDGKFHAIMSENKRREVNEDIDDRLEILENEIEALSYDEELNKELIEEKQNQIEKLLDTKYMIFDPESGDVFKDKSRGQAGIEGYQENLRENFTEMVAGNYIQKGIDKFTRGFLRYSGTGKIMDRTLVGKKLLSPATNRINRTWKMGQDYINGTKLAGTSKTLGKLGRASALHTRHAKFWHGAPTEILEEVANQIIPIYEEDFIENYSQSLKELGKFDFYEKVAVQTLLMGAGFSSLGLGRHGIKYARNKDYRDKIKDERDKRKLFNKLFRELDNSLTDEEIIKNILQRTTGTLFKDTEYMKKITELRKDPNNKANLKEADKYEQAMFFNMLISSAELGLSERYTRTLDRLEKKKGISQDTLKNIAYTKQLSQEIVEAMDKYSNYYDNTEIKNRYINTLHHRYNIEALNKRIAELSPKMKERLEQFKEDNNFNEDEASFTYDLERYREILKNDHTGNMDRFLEAIEKSGDTELIDYANLLIFRNNLQESAEQLEKEIRHLTSFEYQSKAKKFYDEIREEIEARKIKDEKTKKEVQAVLRESGQPMSNETETEVNREIIDTSTKKDTKESFNNDTPEIRLEAPTDDITNEEAVERVEEFERNGKLKNGDIVSMVDKNGNNVKLQYDDGEFYKISRNKRRKFHVSKEEIGRTSSKIVQRKKSKTKSKTLRGKKRIKGTVSTAVANEIDNISKKIEEEKLDEVTPKEETQESSQPDNSQQIDDIERRRQEELKKLDVRNNITEEEINTLPNVGDVAFIVGRHSVEEVGIVEEIKDVPNLTGEGKTTKAFIKGKNKSYPLSSLSKIDTNKIEKIRDLISIAGGTIEQRKRTAKINDNFDAEYVEAVKKGKITKEQALQALEEAGRKDSSAYVEIVALETQTSTSQISTQVTENISEERQIEYDGNTYIIDKDNSIKDTDGVYLPLDQQNEIKESLGITNPQKVETTSETPPNSEFHFDEHGNVVMNPNTDLLEEESEEDAITREELEDEIDYSPTRLDKNNKEHINVVKALEEQLKKALSESKDLTFAGLVAKLIEVNGAVSTDTAYEFLIEAWNNIAPTSRKISKAMADSIYSDNFIGEQVAREIGKILGNVPNEQNAAKKSEDEKIVEEPVVKSSYEYNPDAGRFEGITYVDDISSRLYAGVGLKLGAVLGLNYEQTESGKITVSNVINEAAKVFLNWNNFKEGDKVDFVFNFKYLLDSGNLPMTKWDNPDGISDSPANTPGKLVMTVRERLVEIFKDFEKQDGSKGMSWIEIVKELEKLDTITDRIISNTATEKDIEDLKDNILFKNEEFLRIVPVGIKNNGYTDDIKPNGQLADTVLEGGLNDYYWFNSTNVALRVRKSDNLPDYAEQKERIIANRKILMAARTTILNDGMLSVEIEEYRDAKLNLQFKDEQGNYQLESILSQFESVENFDKFAAIARIDGKIPIMYKHNGKPQSVKINGKNVSIEQITNWKSFLEVHKEDFIDGRTVMIFQTGINRDGIPTYTVQDVYNSPESQQDNFEMQRRVLNSLYFELKDPKNKDIAKKLSKKDMLGYDFVNAKDNPKVAGLDKMYPEQMKNTESGRYRQDYAVEHFGDTKSNRRMIDIQSYIDSVGGTYRDIMRAILEDIKNETLKTISQKELLLKNIHTNIIFTPMSKNGEVIYNPNSQPIMMFNIGELGLKNDENTTPELVKIASRKKQEVETLIRNNENVEEASKELIEIASELKPSEKITSVSDAVTIINNVEKEYQSNVEPETIEELSLEEELSNLYNRINNLEIEIDDIVTEIDKIRNKEIFKENPELLERIIRAIGETEATEENIKEAISLYIPYRKKTSSLIGSERDVSDFINWLNNNDTIESSKRTKLKTLRSELKEARSKRDNIIESLLEEDVSFNEFDKADIVEEVLGRALSKVDITEKTLGSDLLEMFKKELDTLIIELRNKGKELEARFIEDNRDSLINGEDNSVREYLEFMLDVSLEDMLTQTGENVKEFDSSSYEIDFKKSLSYKVKILLAGIKDGRRYSGFAGFQKNISLSDVLDALRQILVEVDNSSMENIKAAIEERISRNEVEFGFYREILKRLSEIEKTHPEVLNEILYGLYGSLTRMRATMWVRDINGNYSLKNYDANAKNPQFIKQSRWSQSLKRNNLITIYESDLYKINESAYKEVLELYERLKESYEKGIQNVSEQDLVNFLNYFGISLNEKTIEAIYNGDIINDIDVQKELFGSGEKLLTRLKMNLEEAKKISATTELSTAKTNNKTANIREFDLLNYKNSQIRNLIDVDNHFQFHSSSTMYLGGKTVQTTQQNSPYLNKMRNLRSSIRDYARTGKISGELEKLQNTLITSNSFLLEQIKGNADDLVRYIDTFLMSLESLKEIGSKSREDMKITDLSDKDAFITLIGMFASSEGSFKNDDYSNSHDNIELRKGVISFPTLSDASQLPMLKTILLNITNNMVNTETGELNETLLKILREHLLVPSLLRISDHITNVTGIGTNIEFYDQGALWIEGFPSLNSLLVPTNEKDESGKPIMRTLITMFKTAVREGQISNDRIGIDKFINKYIKEINKEIETNINQEVDLFVDKNGNGSFKEFEILNPDGTLNINNGSGSTDYFRNKNARLVALDYVINYFIQQAEIQRIFAGDVAYYFKNAPTDDMLVNDMPDVGIVDFINYYYSDRIADIEKIVGNKDYDKLSEEKKQELLNKFPKLKYAKELLNNIDSNEFYYENTIVASHKLNKIFKDAQNNLSKRLKELLSPGNQFPNLKTLPEYTQIIVDDVVDAAENLEYIIQNHYPEKYESWKNDISEFMKLDQLYDKGGMTERWKELRDKLLKEFPNIKDFFKTQSTDAQERVTWRDALQQLKRQGRLTNAEYENINRKLTAQSNDLLNGNEIKEENLLTDEEMSLALMQPSKPLYSGMVSMNVNGHSMERYVYIKSSSFPLIPQLTQMFPKLNSLRKNMEKMEMVDEDGNIISTVRLAHKSAVKVGGVSNPMNISKLYNENIEISDIEKSSIKLSPENFYIQQDKPFKADKNARNGKEDMITRMTQFEKIILGDGISKMGYVFSIEMFDKQLLDELGDTISIKNRKIDGKSMKTIYEELYKREQKILSDLLFDKLKIDSFEDIQNGNPKTMKKLQRLLFDRLGSKQDRESIELLHTIDDTGKVYTDAEIAVLGKNPIKSEFRFPLFLMPNSRKTESVLASIIGKNNINLTLPGYSFIIASQEGFDLKQLEYSENVYDELKSKGLITTSSFDAKKGLQGQKNNITGEVSYAQVFASNKMKILDEKTGQYKYIDLKDYLVEGTNVIDNNKIPKELLSMFSARIPTSSHQSGVIIEIVGFLPHQSGDLLIVPKDHTIQIGEDYDIDVRYAYTFNIIKDEKGNLKKVGYEDINDLIQKYKDKSLSEIRKDYERNLEELINEYYNEDGTLKNPFLYYNRDAILEIIALEEELEQAMEDENVFTDRDIRISKKLDNVLSSMFEEESEFSAYAEHRIERLKITIGRLESQLIPANTLNKENLRNEYKTLKDKLKREYKNRESNFRKSWDEYLEKRYSDKMEKKILENNLISMYKTVFSSSDTEVQNLISKVLTTEFSENSASNIDNKLSKNTDRFNIFSPHTQRKVMKLGADGKSGIAIHSNSVTLNSLLQQSNNPLQFYYEIETKEGKIEIPYNILLGNFVFDGVLGRISDGKRRTSEYLMESQNSATDNQKLEIMGRRNENMETINVFSLLQMSLLEDDGFSILGNKVSYASLFISQPILIEYVNTVKKYKSSTEDSFGNSKILALTEITDKYVELVPTKYWEKKENGEPIIGVLSKEAKKELGKNLTGQSLYNSIIPNTDNIQDGEFFAKQFYILDTFRTLDSLSNQLSELQRFINIEAKGLGISYYDTISLKNKITEINDIKLRPVDEKNNRVKGSLFSTLFGDLVVTRNSVEAKALENEDYILISKKNEDYILVKPNTHYSHKIMNSIRLGYNLWNPLFPYDNDIIQNQVETIIEISGIHPNSVQAQELRYDIIANMKDYAYSSNSTLFPEGIEVANRELFFEDRENNKESLGHYLLRLRDNPNFKYLMDSPFFRDLDIRLGDSTYPTTILYNTGDISKENLLRIDNFLSAMTNSKRKLLSKLDGTEMTEADLMRDLLKYATISNQENGAVGFRNLLPINIFSKYKVDDVMRRRHRLTSENMSYLYNGILKTALKTFNANNINEDGSITNNGKSISELNTLKDIYNIIAKRQTGEDNVFEVRGNNLVFTKHNGIDTLSSGDFIKQYIQHNPNIAYSYNYSSSIWSNFYRLAKLNNIGGKTIGEDILNGSITELADTNGSPFISIKLPDGSYQLFERYDSVRLEDLSGLPTTMYYYRRIPTLGTFAYNEYMANKTIDSSNISKNNPGSTKRTTIVAPNIRNTVRNKNTRAIYRSMIADLSSPYGALMRALGQFIPNIANVQIQIVEDLRGNAGFSLTKDGVGGVLYIREDFLNNASEKAIKAAIMEEFLHYVTKSTIEDYIDVKNMYIDKDGLHWDSKEGIIVPASLGTLMSIYNQAIKHYIEVYGYEKIQNRINKFKEGNIVTSDGLTDTSYRLSNIHEFLAGVFFFDSEFAREMSKTPYLQSKDTILSKFTKTLIRFFRSILPDATKNSIATNTAMALFKFLEEHHEFSKNNKLLKRRRRPDNSSIKESENIIREVTPPTVVENPPVEESWGDGGGSNVTLDENGNFVFGISNRQENSFQTPSETENNEFTEEDIAIMNTTEYKNFAINEYLNGVEDDRKILDLYKRCKK